MYCLVPIFPCMSCMMAMLCMCCIMAMLFVHLLRSFESSHYSLLMSFSFLSSWNGVRFSDFIFSYTYSVFIFFTSSSCLWYFYFFWDVGYLVWVGSLERSVPKGAQHHKLWGTLSCCLLDKLKVNKLKSFKGGWDENCHCWNQTRAESRKDDGLWGTQEVIWVWDAANDSWRIGWI